MEPHPTYTVPHGTPSSPLALHGGTWQVMEEAPDSYKDVSAVVDTCHEAGLSNKCVKLRPIAVIKG